jgi:hypothetical protein
MWQAGFARCGGLPSPRISEQALRARHRRFLRASRMTSERCIKTMAKPAARERVSPRRAKVGCAAACGGLWRVLRVGARRMVGYTSRPVGGWERVLYDVRRIRRAWRDCATDAGRAAGLCDGNFSLNCFTELGERASVVYLLLYNAQFYLLIRLTAHAQYGPRFMRNEKYIHAQN